MKKFMCYWNPEVYSLEKECFIKNELFFSDENGYSDEDTASILNLSMGESVCFDGFDHIITRVK
jgi:hypothetical protein